VVSSGFDPGSSDGGRFAMSVSCLPLRRIDRRA
jgi:hypothetical protein